MVNPEWKYSETIQKRIRVIKINHKDRHLDAQDIDAGLPFCLEANPKIILEKVKKAKIYRATIKVFSAELGGELEAHLTELAMTDLNLRHNLDIIKRSGSNLRKFELVEIK